MIHILIHILFTVNAGKQQWWPSGQERKFGVANKIAQVRTLAFFFFFLSLLSFLWCMRVVKCNNLSILDSGPGCSKLTTSLVNVS